MPGLQRQKYWAPVGRVDNVWGDRNLFCSCPPLSDYAERRQAMAVSVFDLFKIGIGPSSSHTVGPDARGAAVRAAAAARRRCWRARRACSAELYGSLGATGKGHGSDKAVLLGLAGPRARHGGRRGHPGAAAGDPRQRPPARCPARTAIAFDEKTDLLFHRRETLPLPRQRHALRGLRRRRRRAAQRACTTRSAAASSSATRWRPTAAQQKVDRARTPPCCRCPSTAAPSCSR